MLKRWKMAAYALVATGTLAPLSWLSAAAVAADLEKFPGILSDDSQAELTGEWKASTSVAGYVGEGYRFASGPELHSATFKLMLPAEGEYHLLVGYTIGGNRSTNAALSFVPTTGEQTLALNQQSVPQGPFGLHAIGKFRFAAGETKVVISTKEAKGVVIADAVALLTPEQFAAAAKQTKSATKLTATKPAKPKAATPPPDPVEPTPEFVRTPPKQQRELTPGQLDGLLQVALPELKQTEAVSDEQFLRRVSLDLIGRNPTREELVAFVADGATNKRAQLIERQLASPEFGENWANYWSDVISYRVPDPELTFLNYKPFKAWLADSINQGRGWDEITFRILAAQGKVSEHPEATFVGFHQADKSRLASETTRVFLGTQIQCAECHDHKFIDMPQETFHHFAAFFARSQAKISQNDSGGIVVGGKPSGEHTLPGKKDQMTAEAFDMAKVELGASDMQRRGELAKWTVSPENPFFAKAFVNRVWARMMGRGFCEPVDEIGELGEQVLPELHTALADHFIASGYDVKGVYRLIASTDAYQRQLRGSLKDPGDELPRITTTRLRGDEVYQSLVSALELPNITPPQMKPTTAVRFPPPPKSTRDLVTDAFGFDPSLAMDNITKTMNQAMFMMNNEQINRQVDAKPESQTRLAAILASEKDDRAAVKKVFEHVLARQPTLSEVEIAMQHLAEVKDRSAGFEDLLWSLLNSAEFTTRR